MHLRTHLTQISASPIQLAGQSQSFRKGTQRTLSRWLGRSRWRRRGTSPRVITGSVRSSVSLIIMRLPPTSLVPRNSTSWAGVFPLGLFAMVLV